MPFAFYVLIFCTYRFKNLEQRFILLMPSGLDLNSRRTIYYLKRISHLFAVQYCADVSNFAFRDE